MCQKLWVLRSIINLFDIFSSPLIVQTTASVNFLIKNKVVAFTAYQIMKRSMIFFADH